MGMFTALALFLKPLHKFVKLNYLLLHIRNILFVFSHCDGWLREFGLGFPSYLYFCGTGSHGNFMFIITLECSKLGIWMGIHFRDILLIRISRGANNCVQCVFEKNIYFIMIFPPQLNFLIFNERLKQWKLTMQFHSLLWSYLPRVPIF